MVVRDLIWPRRDGRAEAAGLGEGDGGGGLFGEEAEVRVAVGGLELVGDEAAVDGGVGVDD